MDIIIAVTAGDRVGAEAATDDVMSRTTIEAVVAAAAKKGVVVFAAAERIVRPRARQIIRAAIAGKVIADSVLKAACDSVGTITPGHRVGPASGSQHIIARAAGDLVVQAVSVQRKTRRAGRVEQRKVLDLAGQGIGGGGALDQQHRVDAAAPRLADRITSGRDQVGVVVGAAQKGIADPIVGAPIGEAAQRIGAGTARIDAVVAGTAGDGIGPGLGEDGVGALTAGDGVAAGAASDPVIAVIAGEAVAVAPNAGADRVVVGPAEDRVGASERIDAVGADAAVQPVVAALVPQRIGAIAAEDRVGVTAALKAVVAVAADQAVIAVAADQRRGGGQASQVHRIGAGAAEDGFDGAKAVIAAQAVRAGDGAGGIG